MTSQFPWEPVLSKQGHGQVMMSLTLQSTTLITYMWGSERESEGERNMFFLGANCTNSLLLCPASTESYYVPHMFLHSVHLVLGRPPKQKKKTTLSLSNTVLCEILLQNFKEGGDMCTKRDASIRSNERR